MISELSAYKVTSNTFQSDTLGSLQGIKSAIYRWEMPEWTRGGLASSIITMVQRKTAVTPVH